MSLSRRNFIVLTGLTTTFTAAAAVAAPRAASAANTAYVFAYFTETPTMSGANYGLHLAVSGDGLNWQPLNQNNPVVTPTAGTLGLRDPFILRKQDGTFVVLDRDCFAIPDAELPHVRVAQTWVRGSRVYPR